jgi:hypothetical protein
VPKVAFTFTDFYRRKKTRSNNLSGGLKRKELKLALLGLISTLNTGNMYFCLKFDTSNILATNVPVNVTDFKDNILGRTSVK